MLKIMEVDVELFLMWCLGYFSFGILCFIYWLFFDKSEEAMNDKVYVDSFQEIVLAIIAFMFLWPVAFFNGIKKWFTKSRNFPWLKED